MIIQRSALTFAAALALFALPVVAETTATITQGPADACATAAPTTADCPAPQTAVQPAKLGTGIVPLATSGSEDEAEDDED
jgi:hypothetical protein